MESRNQSHEGGHEHVVNDFRSSHISLLGYCLMSIHELSRWIRRERVSLGGCHSAGEGEWEMLSVSTLTAPRIGDALIVCFIVFFML